MDLMTCSIHIIAVVLLVFSKGTSGATFTVTNKCGHTVWPGILANAGSSTLETTGFELPPGASRTLQSPPNWSGRLWGRTSCATDPVTHQFKCATADCGSGFVECRGNGAAPPATLAEFTVAAGGLDFYDVSLVDGYNLQVIIDASLLTGACPSAGCAANLNRACPAELRTSNGLGCMSACEAFRKPEYCCSGEFGSPATCPPTVYSQIFKAACPKSYSYAYDDPTSTFTCRGADYAITFCPTSSTSQKSETDTSPTSTSTDTNTNTNTNANTSNGSSTGTEGGTPYINPWYPAYLTGDSTKLCSYSHLRAVVLLLVSFHLIYYRS